jgi:D-sedoheptulose 7-phosphate isomerase
MSYSILHTHLQESIAAKLAILEDQPLQANIELATKKIISAYKNGNKLFLCGNGGSASDAQHLAAELTGRYAYDRPPLSAEALHTNTSTLTAIANDYGYDQAFARTLQGLATAGDVVICLSTSGNSQNILNVALTAKKQGIYAIAMTGSQDSKLSEIADLTLKMPSLTTPIIQECHITIGHYICHVVEASMFPIT